HRRERRAGLVVEAGAGGQALGHAGGKRVAAVELELMRAVVAEQSAAAVVDLEVGVVIRRVDVRVELAGRSLEGTVVIALEPRPDIAGVELIIVAEALLGVQLDAL